jgi:hypothetical protein
MPEQLIHPNRLEIARYLLARGTQIVPAPEAEAMLPTLAPIEWPDDLAPDPQAPAQAPQDDDPFPNCDVAVITWTADEADALAQVLTPGHSRLNWFPYTKGFDALKDQIRGGAPALNARRLASYFPTQIGSKAVLCIKSELHMNQDGKKTGDGTATLPVKELFRAVIEETEADLILTIGTSGAVFETFGLGDVVITRGAKFRLNDEFKNEPFNGQSYKSNWDIPTDHVAKAEALMRPVGDQLKEPDIGPPTKEYAWNGPPLKGRGNVPQIRIDGHDMPEFWPILTTDYFEYGTSENRLDKEGCAVEMGDAVLGLLCSELNDPPNWGVIRNMSDPVINGDLPTQEFRVNMQTTYAVGYYTAYGHYTSICGAIATWAVIAGLQ